VLPPDQRRRAGRQRAWLPHAGRRALSAVGEALAEQHRQVIAYQPGQLSRRAEGTVGHCALGPDPVEQAGQERLPVGCRSLDVQQLQHAARQVELLLEAGDLHAGTDPAVALPVQPDKYIALLQVCPVQLLRRVRPGAQLEHHRSETQRCDGARDGVPLGSQLA
jgi:hypothetical protein